MDVDNVSDSEKDDRRSMRCCECGLMGHNARDCRGKGKGTDAGTGCTKGEGKTDNGKKEGGQFGGGGAPGESKGGAKDSAGHVEKLDTTRRNVDGESPALTRMVQTAEKVKVNLSQKKTEKLEPCGSLETWRNSRGRKAPAARGADPNAGHMRINAMNRMDIVK